MFLEKSRNLLISGLFLALSGSLGTRPMPEIGSEITSFLKGMAHTMADYEIRSAIVQAIPKEKNRILCLALLTSS